MEGGGRRKGKATEVSGDSALIGPAYPETGLGMHPDLGICVCGMCRSMEPPLASWEAAGHNASDFAAESSLVRLLAAQRRPASRRRRQSPFSVTDYRTFAVPGSGLWPTCSPKPPRAVAARVMDSSSTGLCVITVCRRPLLAGGEAVRFRGDDPGERRALPGDGRGWRVRLQDADGGRRQHDLT